MDSILEWALAVIGSGGIGAAITYISTYKSRQKIENEKAEQEAITTENQHGIMERDRFEAMYKQITEMAEDYNELSDQFRKYRQSALDIETEFINKVREKSNELAVLKDQVNYLKRLRCYDLECPKRIKHNPENHT